MTDTVTFPMVLRPEQLYFLWEARAASTLLSACLELGVFDRLEQGSADAAALARDCGIREETAPALLGALTSLGLAEPDRDGTIDPYRGPAAYAILLGPGAAGLAGDLLGPAAGTGMPVVVGSQTSLDFRPGRYRLSVRSADALEIGDWWAAVLPVETAGQSLAAESALLDAYQPVLNLLAPGFGSNRQGAARAKCVPRCRR